MNQLYTIGYATKAIDVFLTHLHKYNIEVVADIRSVPYSKAFADYHQENIIAHLKNAGFRYVYLGDELGPRSKDDAHYDKCGQVQFDRLMQSELFHQGIKRLEKGLNTPFRIALMCAEKDPATCHRSLLVGYFLQRNPICEPLEVLHIDHDGNAERQSSLEDRVTAMHDKGMDLFMDEEERRNKAYKTQLELTSYKRP